MEVFLRKSENLSTLPIFNKRGMSQLSTKEYYLFLLEISLECPSLGPRLVHGVDPRIRSENLSDL